MTGTRWTWPVLVALVAAAPADAGPTAARKPKSEALVKRLVETIKTDPEVARRRAALADLRDADPRTHPDLIPALVAALRGDPVPAVRADAAETLGQYRLMFPVAGAALEAAAEGDPNRAVRDNAQQALWEYHLLGYRSARGADGFAGQTPEPPIARPAAPRQISATVPDPVPFVRPPTPVLPAVVPPSPVVAVKPTLGPAAAAFTGPKVILTTAPPSRADATAEPPVARPRVLPVAPAPKLVTAAWKKAREAAAEPPGEAADPAPRTARADPPEERAYPLPPLALPGVPSAPEVFANDHGPRVDFPAARLPTGVRRFTSRR